jgi:hypothetical protein
LLANLGSAGALVLGHQRLEFVIELIYFLFDRRLLLHGRMGLGIDLLCSAEVFELQVDPQLLAQLLNDVPDLLLKVVQAVQLERIEQTDYFGFDVIFHLCTLLLGLGQPLLSSQVEGVCVQQFLFVVLFPF